MRAYATNKAGTAYGNDVTFTTTPIVVPTLTTTAVTAITVTTAVSGGNITADGNGVISASGVCWSTAANPTTADPKTTGTTATGAFDSNLTGLLPGTAYHVRAYATNSAGTAYGTDVPFTTTVAIPTLTTTAVTSITLTTAVSGGNITANGGGVISASGVCWSTAANPTTADPKTTGTTATGAFVSNLTGLLPGTAYHVRAYATNSAGTAYGSDVPFTTSSIGVATLSTTAVTVITQTTAISGGNITANGGGVISASGVCWSTAANPTTADPKTTGTTATGAFVSNLTGLLPGTAYHVRAYATNSAGTAYGSDVPFTTTVAIPTLTTSAVTSITTTTAVSGGNITANGGGTVTASGVCWSTAANPTTADPKTTGTTATGAFVSNLTGLLPGTAYHVRAYATNSAGTAYGTDVPFTTTVAIPTLTTTAVTSITLTTAVSGGNITTNGGGVISASGVCWSTAANPTTADPKTTGTTATGAFVSNLTGLLPGTAYHVRAYATNSVGTAYGSDVPFTTTAAGIPTLTTAPVTAITLTTAVSGGNITTNGGGVISASGVCWSTAANPTTADPKTTGTTATGDFVSNITGLSAGTTYYVRAYATNSAGTAYGNQQSFITNHESGTLTDNDGHTYNTVKIGSDWWMAEDLKTTKYRNGDPIGTTTPATLDVSGESTPSYQWPVDGDEGNVATYGRLYTWFTVTDARNICPTGWHVPADVEWETLKTNIGGELVAGGKLKEAGTTHWQTPNTGATNETGFKALPNGYRNLNGVFVSLQISSYHWSSTQNPTPAWAWGQHMYYNDGVLLRGAMKRRMA